MSDVDRVLPEEAADRLAQAVKELESLSRRLAAHVAPGHVDYISKGNAATWVRRIVDDLRK